MKVVTALGNEEMNLKLKNNAQLEIIGKDILYFCMSLSIFMYISLFDSLSLMFIYNLSTFWYLINFLQITMAKSLTSMYTLYSSI